MTALRNKLGYDLVQGKAGAGSAARFKCASCPEELFIPNVNSNGPEVVANWARKKGWICSANIKSDTRCPRCAHKRIANDPDSELKKFQTKMLGDQPMAIEAPKLSVVPPTPTGEQRIAIRNLLDKHFDDKEGKYLDGMSDQAIGEKVNIGALAVKIIREAAYGELIEVDPELQWLTNELAEIKARVKTYEERLSKYAAAKQK